MPITKSYLNSKPVAKVRGLAMTRGINPMKKTKAQLIDLILKHEAKKNKTSAAPVKGIYATKKDLHTQKWIIAYKFLRPGPTSFSIAGKQKYDRAMKAFKDRNFKKVPWGNVTLKK